jgi:hypothetical protein
MAYQASNRKAEQNPTAGRILRTPAPDAISSPRSGAGQGYGANGPVGNSPSVEPGKAVMSSLARNLMESSDDGEGVLRKVIEGGVAGRDDRVPADGNLQTRTISAEPLKKSWGMEKAPTAKMPGAK